MKCLIVFLNLYWFRKKCRIWPLSKVRCVMLPLSDHAIFAHSDSFLNGHQLLAPNNVVASSQLCIKMCLVGYLG